MYSPAETFAARSVLITDISYTIPEAAEVTLIVYDLAGREHARLAGGFQPAGTYTVGFDAAGMATGSYLYRLSAGDHAQTRLMTMVK